MKPQNINDFVLYTCYKTSSCAEGTVKPNQNVGYGGENGLIQGCTRWVAHSEPKTLNSLMDFSKIFLKAKWRRGMVCCFKILSVDMLFSCSCPWMSGHNVPVNFQVKCYYLFCNFLSLHEWKCQVSLFIFLYSCLITAKIWNKRLKFKARDKLQLSCSSSRQIFQDMEWGNPEWVLMTTQLSFLLPVSFSWLCSVQNRASTNHQSGKEMKIGIYLRLIDSCKLHKSRLCCTCLP